MDRNSGGHRSRNHSHRSHDSSSSNRNFHPPETHQNGHGFRRSNEHGYNSRPNDYTSLQQFHNNSFDNPAVLNPGYGMRDVAGRRDQPPSYAESVMSDPDPYLKPIPSRFNGSLHRYTDLDPVALEDVKVKPEPNERPLDSQTVIDPKEEIYADINDNDLNDGGAATGPAVPTRKEQKRQTNKRGCIALVVVILLLLVAGGAIGAVFALRGGTKQDSSDSPEIGERVDSSTTVATSAAPCGQHCLNGTFASDCCECTCPSNTKIGIVLSGDPATPLSEVSIELECGVAIHVTQTLGGYTLFGVCDDSWLTFSKQDYVDFRILYRDLDRNVYLQHQDEVELISPLEMVEHPVSQSVVAGGSVTLSCRAQSYPQPEHYSWYKDGSRYGSHTGNELTLQNVDASHGGHYTCLARTLQTALFSDSAVIRVIDTSNGQNGCENSLKENIITLPGLCTYQGSRTIDLGRCKADTCIGSSNGEHCCGPNGLTMKTIQCGDETHSLQSINSCGCSLCSQSTVDIKGRVGNLNGDTPMAHGYIYVTSGMTVGTNTEGIFEVSDPVSSHRNKLVFHNYNIRSQDYFENTTYIMHMPYIAGDSFETTLDVRLNDRSENPASYGSNSETLTLTFSRTDIDLGEIHIPENSVVNSEGNVVNQFHVYYTVVDPSEFTEIRAVPGDFTVLGEDGQASFLFTLGIFSLEVRNDDGSNDMVRILNEITLSMSRAVPIDTAETFLWKLNYVSGYWEKVGSFVIQNRRWKRSNQETTVTIPGLSTSDNPAWFSIGKISSEHCHSKVRVFKNENDLGIEGSQLQGVEIVYYVKDSSDYAMVSRIRSHSDEGDLNGYCIKHPCRAHDHKLEIYAYMYEGAITGHDILNSLVSNTLNVNVGDDNQLKSDIGMVTQTSAPFYLADSYSSYSSEMCSSADFSENYFRLKANDFSYGIDAIQVPRSIGPNCEINLYRLWHGVDQYTGENEDGFKACYIKIHVPGDTTRQTRIQVISKVGTFETRTGEIYGIREDRIKNEFACVEFRPSGQVGCSSGQTINQDQPQIEIYITDPQSSYDIELDASFDYNYDPDTNNDEVKVTFFMRADRAPGPGNGIYCKENMNKYFAKREARDYCLSYNERSDPGFAIKFTPT